MGSSLRLKDEEVGRGRNSPALAGDKLPPMTHYSPFRTLRLCIHVLPVVLNDEKGAQGAAGWNSTWSPREERLRSHHPASQSSMKGLYWWRLVAMRGRPLCAVFSLETTDCCLHSPLRGHFTSSPKIEHPKVLGFYFIFPTPTMG